MSIFSKFPTKDTLITKTFEIDLTLYEKLEYLSNEVYDASINKLVNACIEELIRTNNLKLFIRPKNEIGVMRSFCIRKNLYHSLSVLKNEYAISFNRLINIAVHNALVEENLIK